MVWLLCAGGVLAQDASNDAAVVTAREAELAATALVVENEQLQSEVAKLRERVGQLTVSLAEAMADLDLERSRRTGEAAAGGVAGRDALDVAEWSVVDVNRSLNMVVFDGGSARGVKPGLNFTVIRDRKALAKVRTIDVREKIAGARVEETSEGKYPEKGDRVILTR